MIAYLRPHNACRISACGIAKNEADNIAKSIDSYRDFVDEIIVVDTGSMDDTVCLAKEHGALVFHFDWCDDFSAAKNFALQHASGSWIIFLDADEYFNEGCGKRLREAIAIAEHRGCNCIGCRMVNLDKDSGVTVDEMYQIRVFKSEFRYIHPVHESIFGPHGIIPLDVHKSWFFLYHTGYSFRISRKKAERNKKLLIERLSAETDPQSRTLLYLYLSDSSYALEEFDDCRRYAKLYLENRDKYHTRMVGLGVKLFINILWSLDYQHKPLSESKKWLLQFEKEFPDHPETHYACGRILFRERRFESALAELECAERLSQNYDDQEVNSVESYNTLLYYYRGLCHEGLWRDSDAYDDYLTSLYRSAQEVPISRLLSFLKKQRPEDVNAYIKGLLTTLNAPQTKRLMAGLMTNYMTEPLLLCYAKFQIDEKTALIDANVAAHVQAGRGKFEEAALLFLTQNQLDPSEKAAANALLCAAISQSATALEQATFAAPPYARAALGLPGAAVLPEDLRASAGLAAEAERMGKEAFAEEIIDRLLEKDAGQAETLAAILEEMSAFPLALRAVSRAPADARTIFLRGYYRYRTGRLGEAEDRIRFAQARGYREPDADAVLETIRSLFPAGGAEKMKEGCAEAAELLEEGRFFEAEEKLSRLRDTAEPTAEWYSTMAVTRYYRHRDIEAGLTAEAGLERFPQNTDLLSNAGDIFSRMGFIERAGEYYRKALRSCTDPALAVQIRQLLDALPAV